MRYLALCTDYDGTIAHHGRVDDATLDALERLRESGRKLVMVTGREIPDLETVFPRFDLFVVRVEPSQTERKRHLRKYAEGSLPEDRSFYFRGPQGKLRLRCAESHSVYGPRGRCVWMMKHGCFI